LRKGWWKFLAGDFEAWPWFWVQSSFKVKQKPDFKQENRKVSTFTKTGCFDRKYFDQTNVRITKIQAMTKGWKPDSPDTPFPSVDG